MMSNNKEQQRACEIKRKQSCRMVVIVVFIKQLKEMPFLQKDSSIFHQILGFKEMIKFQKTDGIK